MTMTTAPSPRIYVASLADYNAGRLHGIWIDATGDPDTVHGEITTMLAASREPNAEEYAIHDYDGFASLHLSEYEPIDMVLKIAAGIARHGDAFAAWADYLGSTAWDELDRFDDVFSGTWPSLRAYAEDLLDSCGIDLDPHGWAPQLLAPYVSVDLDAFARDLGSEYVVCDASGGGVHIFEP